MYVVIAGGGLIGGSLARKLAANRHDVVVVERDKSVCEEIAARIGVLSINGPATSIEALEEAGIQKADVAIGALPRDGDMPVHRADLIQELSPAPPDPGAPLIHDHRRGE